LGLLDALFLVFVVIQLRYFFGGTDLIQRTTGLTYAEYARRGFFELVAASALVLPILLAADWAVRNEAPQQRRSFRSLAGLLILLLAVVMASALERMRLYVDQFGLSEVRLYATAFMVYVAGIVGWFGWTVLRGQPRRFAFGPLVQGFAVPAGPGRAGTRSGPPGSRLQGVTSVIRFFHGKTWRITKRGCSSRRWPWGSASTS